MRHHIIFFVFVAAGLLSARASAQDDGPGGFFLQNVLRELSLRNGDVFALELFQGEKVDVSSRYAQMDLNVINAYTSSEKLLRAYFPRYEVVQSRAQPKLHFVICRETNSVRSYAMEQKLNDFRFEGSPKGLISGIGETVPSLKTITFEPIPNLNKLTLLFNVSKVKLSLQAGDVRDVLSAGIDYEKTKGIIWVATTRIKDGKPQTEVGYTTDAVFSEDK